MTETAHQTAPGQVAVGFLGPPGTFTEQALLTQSDLAAVTRTAFPTMADILHATADGEIDLGFAAIENSIEGTVNITLDTLAFDLDLLIQREVVIPIVMNLLVRPGTALGDVRTVVSYPHAVAQCRGFLREHLPDAAVEAATSTAEAVRHLAEVGDGSTAAIGTALAGELYGLDIVAEDIEDHPENKTRFVLVARTGIPAPTGHDKTSIVIFQRDDRPGSLLSILQEFAARSINLTKLESRPTKQALGDYCFIIDLEGHIADELVADCLKNIRAKQADVKFLGSYPAGGDESHEVRAEVSASWREAEDWISDLRRAIS